MESFFVLRWNNVLDRHHRTSRQQLRIAIVTWSDGPTTADAVKPASVD